MTLEGDGRGKAVVPGPAKGEGHEIGVAGGIICPGPWPQAFLRDNIRLDLAVGLYDPS